MANISCSSEDYDSPFIPEELFEFHLIRKGVVIHNISSVTVISPFSYKFKLPERYYNCTIEDTFMRMAFRGENMSNTDILFCTNKDSGMYYYCSNSSIKYFSYFINKCLSPTSDLLASNPHCIKLEMIYYEL